MTPPVDHAVRVAVRDLAAQARPVNLVPTALARGRRLRRRMRVLRASGAAAAAVAVLAAIAVPTLWLGRGPGHPAQPGSGVTGSVSPGPIGSTLTGALQLADGWIVIMAGSGPFQVWNRDRQRYETVQGRRVYAAPAGPYVAITGETTNYVDVLDLRGRNPRRITLADGFILDPQWSPDGTRLLLTTLAKGGGGLSATILDAGSGQHTKLPLPDGYVCTDRCQFTWSRDGTEIALPLTDQSAAHDEAQPDLRSALQLFSATSGRPTRTLPVRGEPAGPFAWSLDGRLVVVRCIVTSDGRRHEQNQLVDVATGAVVREFPADHAYWIDNDRILVSSLTGPILLLDPAGATLATYYLPPQLVGSAFPELGRA